MNQLRFVQEGTDYPWNQFLMNRYFYKGKLNPMKVLRGFILNFEQIMHILSGQMFA